MPFGYVNSMFERLEGIVQAINKLNITFKIVVRLKGFNEAKGKELLNEIFPGDQLYPEPVL